MEYEVALIKTNKSPFHDEPLLPAALWPKYMSDMAPAAPINTPATFLEVMPAFKNSALITSTIMGTDVIINAEFNGDVRFNPLKKNN